MATLQKAQNAHGDGSHVLRQRSEGGADRLSSATQDEQIALLCSKNATSEATTNILPRHPPHHIPAYVSEEADRRKDEPTLKPDQHSSSPLQHDPSAGAATSPLVESYLFICRAYTQDQG